MKFLRIAFKRETVAPMLALTFASGVSVLLVIARIIWTERIAYTFLIWNLFLAWLPLVFALLACNEDPAWDQTRMAVRLSCGGMVHFLSQRAIHFYRFDPSDRAFLQPFLGGHGLDFDVRRYRSGDWLCFSLSDAIHCGARRWACSELGFCCPDDCVGQPRNLPGPVPAIQQLGCRDAARTVVPRFGNVDGQLGSLPGISGLSRAVCRVPFHHLSDALRVDSSFASARNLSGECGQGPRQRLNTHGA